MHGPWWWIHVQVCAATSIWFWMKTWKRDAPRNHVTPGFLFPSPLDHGPGSTYLQGAKTSTPSSPRDMCINLTTLLQKRSKRPKIKLSLKSNLRGLIHANGNPDKTGELHNPKPSFQSEIGSEISGKLWNMWNVFSEETIRMLFATDCLCGLVHIDCTGFLMGQWSAINMSPKKWHKYAIVGHKYVLPHINCNVGQKISGSDSHMNFLVLLSEALRSLLLPFGQCHQLVLREVVLFLIPQGWWSPTCQHSCPGWKHEMYQKKPWKTGKPWFSTGFSRGWCTVAVAIDWSRKL